MGIVNRGILFIYMLFRVLGRWSSTFRSRRVDF